MGRWEHGRACEGYGLTTAGCAGGSPACWSSSPPAWASPRPRRRWAARRRDWPRRARRRRRLRPRPADRAAPGPVRRPRYRHVIWIVFENQSARAMSSATGACPSLNRLAAAVRPRDALLRGGPPVAAELPRDDLRRDPGRHRRQQRPAGGRQHLRPGAAQRPRVAPLRVRHAARLRPRATPRARIARDLHRPPRAADLLPLDRSATAGAGTSAWATRRRWRTSATSARGPLADALRRNRLPAFATLGPTDDGGNSAAGGEVDPVKGDAFLARWIPRITASRAYRGGPDRDLHHLGRARRLQRPAPGADPDDRRRAVGPAAADGSPRAWTTTRCSARPRTCSACAATSAPQRTPRPCGARSASRHGGPSPASPRDTSVGSPRGDDRPHRSRRVRPSGRRSA